MRSKEYVLNSQGSDNRNIPNEAENTALKNRLVRLLLQNDFTVTGRMYNGYETDTGYHHYTVDAAQYYETEE